MGEENCLYKKSGGGKGRLGVPKAAKF